MNGNPSDFNQYNETYGISRISDEFVNEYNMQNHLMESQQNHVSNRDIVDLPYTINKAYTKLTDHLDKIQGVKYAILPIHTQEEKEKYIELLSKNKDLSKVKNDEEWIELCKKWSLDCNGITIFYKSPQHLNAYHDKMKDKNNYYDSVIKNTVLVRKIRQIISSRNQSDNHVHENAVELTVLRNNDLNICTCRISTSLKITLLYFRPDLITFITSCTTLKFIYRTFSIYYELSLTFLTNKREQETHFSYFCFQNPYCIANAHSTDKSKKRKKPILSPGNLPSSNYSSEGYYNNNAFYDPNFMAQFNQFGWNCQPYVNPLVTYPYQMNGPSYYFPVPASINPPPMSPPPMNPPEQHNTFQFQVIKMNPNNEVSQSSPVPWFS